MNSHVLINTIVQQTMVFVAQLATAGGVRAPLAHIADQVFLELTAELTARGLRKNVIADMFGMALRTYHRRLASVEQSRTVQGSTVWAAVFDYLRQHEPVSGAKVLARFCHDDAEIVAGVLSDLSNSGLVYRAGRGDAAMYRVASERDFDEDDVTRASSNRYLVWLAVYRGGPLRLDQIAKECGISEHNCRHALQTLEGEGIVRVSGEGTATCYVADHFEVLHGETHGWEAAVVDHFQAMVAAITKKLGAEGRSLPADVIGGSTWSLDVWVGHPLHREARSTLSRLRREVDNLRERIDAINTATTAPPELERVVVYLGQHVTEVGEET